MGASPCARLAGRRNQSQIIIVNGRGLRTKCPVGGGRQIHAQSPTGPAACGPFGERKSFAASIEEQPLPLSAEMLVVSVMAASCSANWRRHRDRPRVVAGHAEYAGRQFGRGYRESRAAGAGPARH